MRVCDTKRRERRRIRSSSSRFYVDVALISGRPRDEEFLYRCAAVWFLANRNSSAPFRFTVNYLFLVCVFAWMCFETKRWLVWPKHIRMWVLLCTLYAHSGIIHLASTHVTKTCELARKHFNPTRFNPTRVKLYGTATLSIRLMHSSE